MIEFEGLWVRRAGILIPTPPTEPDRIAPVSVEQPQPATSRHPVGFEALTIENTARAASDESLRKAHSRWNRGIRDPQTAALNREWERRNKQHQRARLASRRKDTPQ